MPPRDINPNYLHTLFSVPEYASPLDGCVFVCIFSDGQRLGHRPGLRYLHTIPTPFGPKAIWVKHLPVDKQRPIHVTPTVKTAIAVNQLTEPLLQDNEGAVTFF